MPSFFNQFIVSESGSVTTDWIVLSAGVVFLGIFSGIAVVNGSLDLAADIDVSLQAVEPGTTDG